MWCNNFDPSIMHANVKLVSILNTLNVRVCSHIYTDLVLYMATIYIGVNKTRKL